MTMMKSAALALAFVGFATTTGMADNVSSPPVQHAMNKQFATSTTVKPGMYRIAQVNVNVPKSLTVTEDSVSLKPRADILWQEEPQGDRHKQVDDIMTEALAKGVATANGPRAVVLDVTMTQFHATNAAARRFVGGDQEIGFNYVLRDARTGENLMQPVAIRTAFKSLSGQRARAAEAAGINQEYRIRAYVAKFIAAELGL